MSMEAVAAKWRDRLLSTEPVDRDRAEAALRNVYREAGLAEPAYFLWCSSPLEACWAVLAVVGKTDGYNHAVVESVQRSKAGREGLERARVFVAEPLGIAEQQVEGAFGKPFYQAERTSAVAKQLQESSIQSWMARAEGGDAYLSAHNGGPFHDLHQLEEALFYEGIRSRTGRGSHYPEAVAKAGVKPLGVLALRSAQHRLYGSLAFVDVAMDQSLAETGKLQPSPLQRAMWEAYEACGMWWPCERGVILAERPIAAELSDEGPRMEWADGFIVGGRPASAAPSAKPIGVGSTPAADRRTASLIDEELPRSHQERIAFLRARSPALPQYERYLAGDHGQVWKDLVALGEKALADDHIADSLAVAYETMHRVGQNVRTIAQRLEALGYAFVMPGSARSLFGFGKPRAHRPVVPPDSDTPEKLAELEEIAGGPIPLSLRAFFDVVGEVNFNGEHASLAPGGATICPDPLMVCGVEEAIGSIESYADECEDVRIIALAPDALHKANVSGGDPYPVQVPAAAADAMLEEEPHGVTFVEYLRTAILDWGGFPGWENAPSRPGEIEQLRQGLTPF